MSYSPEQIEACILAYRNGDLNYCRAGIIDLLTAYAATLRQSADSGRVGEEDAVATAARDPQTGEIKVTLLREFDVTNGMPLFTRAALEAALAAQGQGETCPYCDNTGDVHGIDGEWRGECTECLAAKELHPAPAASPAGVPEKFLTIGTRVMWEDNVGRKWPCTITGYTPATYDAALDDGTDALGYPVGRFSAAAPSAPEGDGGEG